jgi:hypothetical protein
MTNKPTKRTGDIDINYDSVLGDISNVIDTAKKSAVRSINCIMTAAYWLIGRRIVEFEQGGKKRAEYGEALLRRLSVDLADRYGRGFGVDNLQRFRAFYLTYPTNQIYATVSRKSSLGHNDEKYATPSHIFQVDPTDSAHH